MPYSELEQKALEVFVTSATDAIAAVKNTLPIEVFGALGSFFSRNPKDFRAHLLDAIYGRIKGYETEGGEENLRKLAAGEFNPPHLTILSGIAKSQDFFRTFYGGYSHKSIANTVWIPMIGTNVSQLFAKELAYDQLAFFIEQSTRYVEFDKTNLLYDPQVMESGLKTEYVETLEKLVNTYGNMIGYSTEYYKQQIPFNQWLGMQDEKVRKKSEEQQRREYERQIRGKAFDVARYLLPQASRTNIAWIVDARSLEFDIAAWKGHPLVELQEAAALIEKHAGQIAPSLLKYTEKNPYYEDKLHGYDGILAAKPADAFSKGVDIIHHDRDGLNKVIAHLLQRHNYGGTLRERLNEARDMPFARKMEILKRITEKRQPTDEKLETDEELDLVKLTVEIRSDVGAIRDLRRHQKNDRGESLLTLENGWYTPQMIFDMNTMAYVHFKEAMEKTQESERKIRKEFPFASQYIVPMAAMHTLTMSLGLDQLQYFIWTRSTPQGHFSYRQDVINLAERVAQIYPWLLGYKEYPEGKDFETVYREAPLKKLLPVRFGETGLHQ